MSWSAFDVVGPGQALADSLHEHRNEILRLDCRVYPSTSMKSGLSTKELFKNHFPIRAIMEGQIVALKKRLLQTELEADFDKLNSRTGDDLTQSSLELAPCAVAQRGVPLDQNHGFPHVAQTWDVRKVHRRWICDFSNSATTRAGGFVFAVRVAAPARTRRGC